MFGPLYLVARTAVRPAPADGFYCLDKESGSTSLSKGSARTGLDGAGHWTLGTSIV